MGVENKNTSDNAKTIITVVRADGRSMGIDFVNLPKFEFDNLIKYLEDMFERCPPTEE